MMSPELIICIPGPWADRRDFVSKVIACEPMGRYMFAGMILADVKGQDHVGLEFCNRDTNIPKAFQIAGQGQLSADLLARLEAHSSVVYLHFPLDFPGQKERIFKFTKIIQQIGGMAVKLESSGIAHTWERWHALLPESSFNLFDLYRASVVLIGDKNCYYSCGMHHFGLPECMVPRSIPGDQAANLMNQFNHWQIVERPKLSTGHTFSLNPKAPHYRLSLVQDTRHDNSLFHNPHGVWSLAAV